MTALGNVMALVRELDDEASAIPVAPVPDVQNCELPPALEDASSLGEVLALIREMQRDSLGAFVDSLPPVRRRVPAEIAG